jgi:Tol biopolymer transport system component
MKKLLVFALLCLSLVSFGQAGSEIILFDLKIKKGKVTLSNPKNITKHPGYDNQPSFHPDLPYIYYSSFNEDGRSDIRRYNFAQDTTVSITSTSEREYSPTLTPDKQFISCIIQRDNGEQDLGKYPVDGGEPSLIIDNLMVGYHLWTDNSHLALFILGAGGSPNTLHYVRLPTKEDTVLATNIGRSFHKVPYERSFTFIQKGDSANTIMKFNTETQKLSPVTTTINKGEDIAISQDGHIFTSDGSRLFFKLVRKPSGRWIPVEIVRGAELLKSVTRIAVNARGNKIAVVVAE